MQADRRVSLLVLARPSDGVMPQALARVTLQGDAHQCPVDAVDHESARGAYLARFPQSAQMFGLADFSLFIIVPRQIRVVEGFARAWSGNADDYITAMTGQR
jgi:putative heme iron utilization protein